MIGHILYCSIFMNHCLTVRGVFWTFYEPRELGFQRKRGKTLSLGSNLKTEVERRENEPLDMKMKQSREKRKPIFLIGCW
jgi:hypothetical protein